MKHINIKRALTVLFVMALKLLVATAIVLMISKPEIRSELNPNRLELNKIGLNKIDFEKFSLDAVGLDFFSNKKMSVPRELAPFSFSEEGVPDNFSGYNKYVCASHLVERYENKVRKKDESAYYVLHNVDGFTGAEDGVWCKVVFEKTVHKPDQESVASIDKEYFILKGPEHKVSAPIKSEEFDNNKGIANY